MSSRLPRTTARERPENLAILLREAFAALNDLALARLAERGHGAVRPAHGAVFQYLDDGGTTVSTLAERARMTKQSMAELVRHLEAHGYVERLPDRRTAAPSSCAQPTAARGLRDRPAFVDETRSAFARGPRRYPHAPAP